MKKLSFLITYGVLILLSACNQNLLVENNLKHLGEISSHSYQFIEIDGVDLPNGAYQANLAHTPLPVTVRDGKMYWLMPELAIGSYIFKLAHGTKQYEVITQILASSKMTNVKEYVLQFSEQYDLSISKGELTTLSDHELRQLAEFMKMNKHYFEKEKVMRNQLSKNRLSAIYTSLNIGEQVSIEVASAEYWNGSGVFVTTGQVFQIEATGTWTDWYIDTDANGYSSWYLNLFTLLKRDKSEKWFKLIASINQDKNYPIGTTAIITANETGPLDFYANDANGFYWNNYGSIQVTITRIQ